MKRAEIVNAQQPLAVVTRDKVDAPPKGLLLKTSYAGVCHTDVHFLKDEKDLGDGKVRRVRDLIGEEKYKGTVQGHEISGVIEEFGNEAKRYDLSIGDRVAVMPWIGCYQDSCMFCANGENNRCDKNIAGTSDIGQGPPGGFSTHVPVPDCKYVVKVPNQIPMDVACMLPCSASTMFSALKNAKPFMEMAYERAGSSKLLVIGAGGLGLWGIKLAKQYFKNLNVSITSTDIDKEQLRRAVAAGADRSVVMQRKPTPEEVAGILTENRSHLYDAVLDIVGMQSTTEAALHSLQNGGILCIMGQYGGKMSFPIPFVIMKALTIRGIRVSNVKILKELIQFVSENPIKFEEVEYYSLDDINIAYEKLEKGEVKGRAIIKHEK